MDGRARAAVTAGAVQDDAHQDERHAGDPDQVRKVLVPEVLVAFMAGQSDVDDNVEHASGGDDQQADEHERRQSPKSAQDLYHQHAL